MQSSLSTLFFSSLKLEVVVLLGAGRGDTAPLFYRPPMLTVREFRWQSSIFRYVSEIPDQSQLVIKMPLNVSQNSKCLVCTSYDCPSLHSPTKYLIFAPSLPNRGVEPPSKRADTVLQPAWPLIVSSSNLVAKKEREQKRKVISGRCCHSVLSWSFDLIIILHIKSFVPFLDLHHTIIIQTLQESTYANF